MKKRKLRVPGLLSMPLLAFVASTLLWGCYPNSSKNVGEFDTVITYHNKNEIDYGSYTTYAIMDSVLALNSDGEYENNNGQFDQQIIANIKANMNARGYVYESDPEANGATMKIICKAANSTTYIFYSYYPGYGGGCYYCGGWYYPWYPTTGVSSYTTGTLVVDITDPNNVDPGTGAEAAIWTAALNGLLSGSDANIGQRIDQGVDQAFTQSPYLMTAP